MSFQKLKISALAALLATAVSAPAMADQNTQSVNPSENLPDASVNEQTGRTTNDNGPAMPWLFPEETGSVAQQAPQNTNPSEDDPTVTATENQDMR